MPNWRARAPLKQGERIGGIFDVYRVLGHGSFGIVYLVFDREIGRVCALKTFLDELLANPAARSEFKQEASRWADIGEHPYILSAHSVIEVLNRLYVRMDYVAPDEDGRVSLADYLRGNARQAIETETQLEWGVQFCLGMEHANKRGIHCHRDIKPGNILITSDGVLKISDFGLAVVSGPSSAEPGQLGPPVDATGDGYIGLSVWKAGGRNVCGTPGYIPPEVYRGETADVRSDIFSFGAVLWQMASQSPVAPFSPNKFNGNIDAYIESIYQAQMTAQLTPLDSPLQPIIFKCLCRNRLERYRDFSDLRADLEPLLLKMAGRSVQIPDEAQKTSDSWYHRGRSLESVGRYEDAMAAFEHGLELSPRNPRLTNGKARALLNLGRKMECILCCEQVLFDDPKNFQALCEKGRAYEQLQEKEKALACFEECVRLYPRSFTAWHNRSFTLNSLGRFDEALAGSERAVALQPRAPRAWDLKGVIQLKMGKHQEAIASFDQALMRDPQFVAALTNKGVCLTKLQRFTDAIACFDAALEINPGSARAWAAKTENFLRLKKYPKAVACGERALALDPAHVMTWYNKGVAEHGMRDFRACVASLSRFLELAKPGHQAYVPTARSIIQRLTARR